MRAVVWAELPSRVLRKCSEGVCQAACGLRWLSWDEERSLSSTEQLCSIHHHLCGALKRNSCCWCLAHNAIAFNWIYPMMCFMNLGTAAHETEQNSSLEKLKLLPFLGICSILRPITQMPAIVGVLKSKQLKAKDRSLSLSSPSSSCKNIPNNAMLSAKLVFTTAVIGMCYW